MQPWQTALVVTGSVVGLAAVSWPILSWLQVKVLEKPRYSVIRSLGSDRSWWTGKTSAELRQYAPYLIAEVTVKDASLRQALNQGFRQVAAYIFGGNEAVGMRGGSESVAMTSPVRVEKAEGRSESIAMTSPVAADLAGDGVYRVSFMMPSKYTKDNIPRPKNPDVIIKEVAPRTVAAIAFSGNIPNEGLVREKEAALRKLLAAEGLEVDGAPMLFQYHPPFAPGFVRRNEVLLAIKEED